MRARAWRCARASEGFASPRLGGEDLRTIPVSQRRLEFAARDASPRAHATRSARRRASSSSHAARARSVARPPSSSQSRAGLSPSHARFRATSWAPESRRADESAAEGFAFADESAAAMSALRPMTVSSSGSYRRSLGARSEGACPVAGSSFSSGWTRSTTFAASRSRSTSLSAGIVSCSVRGLTSGSNPSASSRPSIGATLAGSSRIETVALVTISS